MEAGKQAIMFDKLTKSKLAFNIIKHKSSQAFYHYWQVPLYSIQWYPNSKSCVGPSTRQTKLGQMPPLMVRKPEWRR